MADTYQVDRPLVAMPPALAHEWKTWLCRHGIDPDEVALPGWIKRHPVQRQISYVGYLHDENGHVLNEDRTDVLRVTHVVQLEAAPAPFPKLEETDHG